MRGAHLPTGSTLLTAALIGLSAAGPVRAVETVGIGRDGDLDWRGDGAATVATIDARHRSPLEPNVLVEGNTPGDLVELSSEVFPGALLPRRIQSGENVAEGTLARGGGITAPNVFDFSGTFKPLDLKQALEEMLTADPGGELLAFERKDFNSLGILVILNLGGRFGVERIRFYPRNTVVASPATPFQNDFIRAYELFVNDGVNLTRQGLPIWGDPLARATDNKEAVVEVVLDPPQYVQYLRLRSTSPIDFEIDEFEVFGFGFLASATYLSDIFDAGQPAVWRTLRWVEETVGDSKFSGVRIRTRTGTDDNPFVFTRVLHGQRDPQEIPLSVDDPGQELTLKEYRKLPKFDALGRQWNAGPVKDDLIHWSPFSTPLPPEAANGPGVPITSPGPRRYMQIQIRFDSNDLEAARVIERLSFDLLRPPLADELVGEVFPRQVDETRSVPLTYAVRARFGNQGLKGYDTMEIGTPLRVGAIDEIELLDSDGRRLGGRTFGSLADTTFEDGFRIRAVTDDAFSVQFPRVAEDGSVVRIRFRSDVLTYSTNFTAAASLSAEPGATQSVVPGDAADLGPGDESALSGTTVLSPALLTGNLLRQLEFAPNPFTPNGDGVNDEIVLAYNLVSVGEPRAVQVEVYDLSGRRLRVVFDGDEANGRYEDKVWDGRDEAGNRVPPGLYVVRVGVRGDARDDAAVQVVGVAY